jgi:hypothetical protein
MSSFVTNAGFANNTSAWVAASSAKYIGWGTGSGQTAASNALAAAAAEARTTGTLSQVTTTVTNDTYQVAGTITATGTRAITEVGVFDAAAAGNMDIYGDFSVVNLASGDSISFTIKVKVS